jgi:hypothetical protein
MPAHPPDFTETRTPFTPISELLRIYLIRFAALSEIVIICFVIRLKLVFQLPTFAHGALQLAQSIIAKS